MPLFTQKSKTVSNPKGPAIPDFTNQDKMIEYVNGLRSNPDALRGFLMKLGMLRKDVQRRWYRVSYELDFIDFYKKKKESGSFEPNYCVVKWHKNYTRHVSFWGSIHRKYEYIKNQHAVCYAGQGFYTYDESIKELRKWIENIIDPELLTKIEACLIAGINSVYN